MSSQGIRDARVPDTIRSGALRIALFLPLYSTDPVIGKIRAAGVEGTYLMEIARALAERLGVDIQLTGYKTPAEAMEGLRSGASDLSFFGIDSARAADLDFSRPIVQADFTCLVPANSAIQLFEDVDRPGTRIAVVRNHGSTKALGRLVEHAGLVYGETPEATLSLLRSGNADALASVRTLLEEFSSKLSGFRVLDDRYGELLLAIAIPKGQPGWLDYICEFIEEAKASGLVQRAIDNAGARGVSVAP